MAGQTVSDLATIPADAIMVPGTGELVDRNDEVACARALADVRALRDVIAMADRELTGALIERSVKLGSKTITMPDGGKAIITGGESTSYDGPALEASLRRAGMPEDRIREIVVETVSYTVKAVEAKRAAGANPAYARAVKKHSRTIEKASYITLKQ